MASTLRERIYSTERTIRLSDTLVLVESKSDFGTWHAVERLNGHLRCDCLGFQYRGKCRHLAAFAEAQGETVEEALPPSARPPTWDSRAVLAVLNGE